MAYAKNEFYLSRKEKGFEATNREILTHLERSTGQTQKELEQSRNRPKLLFYVWEWFCEVFQGEPLSFQELYAWSSLRNIPVDRNEVKLLRDLSKLCLTT